MIIWHIAAEQDNKAQSALTVDLNMYACMYFIRQSTT